MDVRQRLVELTQARGWTLYRLSKESGVHWSTIRNMFERDTQPTLPTVEALCRGLGIEMSDLFYDDERATLSAEQQNLLAQWNTLNDNDKAIVLSLLKSLNQK